MTASKTSITFICIICCFSYSISGVVPDSDDAPPSIPKSGLPILILILYSKKHKTPL